VAEPVMSQWGERLRERTQPLQPNDELYGWAHAILCEALAQPYLQVCALIDPPEPYPPWGPLFDVNVCPAWALPWLAQLVGVRIPAGMSEEDTRVFLKQAAGHNVGTVEAIRASLMGTLVSARPPAPATVYFRERDGSAYRLEVVTLDPETPDPALTQRVLESVLPGGLVLAYRHIEGWDYQAMTDESAEMTPPGTYADLALAYATYHDLREHGGAVRGPSLSSVIPRIAPNEAGIALTLNGYFPEPFSVNMAVDLVMADNTHHYGDAVKVSDTLVTSTFDFSPVAPGSGTIKLHDLDTYTDYTNAVPYVVVSDPTLSSVVPEEFDSTIDAVTSFTLSGFFPGDLTAKRVIFQDAEYGSDWELTITVGGTYEITAEANLMTVPAGEGVIFVANADYTPWTNTLPLTSIAEQAPTLTSCTPAEGPEGTAVTLSGTGLTGVVTVVLDNGYMTLATNVVVVDDSTVTCVMASAPAGATGPCDVRVTGPLGTAELLAGWSFTSGAGG